jgi:hypothetical protein
MPMPAGVNAALYWQFNWSFRGGDAHKRVAEPGIHCSTSALRDGFRVRSFRCAPE